MITKKHTLIFVIILFVIAAGLRVSFCWLNPPGNAYDDHFEPISMIMKQGHIPAKDACWECNQPPFYYILSAMLGHVAIMFGAGTQGTMKTIQLLSCVCGILNLAVIYYILKKLRIPDFARVLAFGTVCFLPRHIYMCAMLSNDTISYLFVSLSLYVLMITLEKKFALHWCILSSVVLLLTIFTKHTALVVLPVAVCMFVVVFIQRYPVSRKAIVIMGVIILLIPFIFLIGSIYSNIAKYGKPLPTNIEIMDGYIKQIQADTLDFYTFKPWTVIRMPIVYSGNIDSFWTLIYGRMWFDMEPKFLYFTDPNGPWWQRYYCFIKRNCREFPEPVELSTFTRLTGSGLITMGLVPLALIITGFGYCIRKRTDLWDEDTRLSTMIWVLPSVLFLFNAAGIIMHVVKFPYYSHMKAAFMLPSLPVYAIFLGFGLLLISRTRALRWITAVFFLILFSWVTAHFLDIIISIPRS